MESSTVRAVKVEISRTIGEVTIAPFARIRSVHVFALFGRGGRGLIAEREEQFENEPGVFRSIESVYLLPEGARGGRVVELIGHSWDAWLHASQTQDRTWLQVPRPQMYAERDRRTSEIAERLDEAQGFDVPPGAVPALRAGLPPPEVEQLVKMLLAIES